MKVTEIMTRNPVSTLETSSVLESARIMFEKDLPGLPVVDSTGTLVGLVSQSTLVTGNHIHIPTVLSLIKKFKLYRKDRKFFQDQIDQMSSLKVRDIMNQEPPLIYEGESLDQALMHLSNVHGVSPTSVVSLERKLVGVITRHDVFRFYGENKFISQAPTGNPSLVNSKIDDFINKIQEHFYLISRWRTKVWLTTNIVFLITGILVAAFFMLRISVK